MTRARMNLPSLLPWLFAAGLASGPALAQQPTVDQSFAVVLALDKVTARSVTLTLEVGQEATFGTLTLKLEACRSTPPEEVPEDVMFIEVHDTAPGSHETRLIYSGWMFASAPSVASLEHPIYDIWLVDCLAEMLADEPTLGEQRFGLPDNPPPPPALPDWRR